MVINAIKYSLLAAACTGIVYGLNSTTAITGKLIDKPVSIAVALPVTEADSLLPLWHISSAPPVLSCKIKVRKNKLTLLTLNYAALKAKLLKAPEEKNKNSLPQLIIDLPYPDGSFQPFSITRSAILPPELIAKYPELNAYTGVNTSQAAESVRCECTGEGFRAMITTLKGEVLINSCSKKDSLIYLSYYKSDLISPKKKKFEKKLLSTTN